jgi:hypothetical protein
MSITAPVEPHIARRQAAAQRECSARSSGWTHQRQLVGRECPQRDSNPRYHLERVATWAASRWGRPTQDSRGARLHWLHGPVAQLVEQGTFNPKVAGSIPARPIQEVPRKSSGRRVSNDRSGKLESTDGVRAEPSHRKSALHLCRLQLSLRALPVAIDVGRRLQRGVAEIARQPRNLRAPLERTLRERAAHRRMDHGWLRTCKE